MAGTLATAAVLAAPPQSPSPQRIVPWSTLQLGAPQLVKHWKSLTEADALEKLRTSNPRHYAIARRILAAADEICEATKAGTIATKYDAQDISCARSFWLTSNPPKRFLQFRIDDTAYSALVVALLPAPKFNDGPDIATPP
jgi:hypothetical protein